MRATSPLTLSSNPALDTITSFWISHRLLLFSFPEESKVFQVQTNSNPFSIRWAPTGDLTKTLEKTVQKKKIIVCLDEVDRLKDFDLLYVLSRGGCGLILVSTNSHALAVLTNRIRSGLSLTEIELPAYKTEELYGIIRDRAEYAFRLGALKNELMKIASVAALGDARKALEIVRKAGTKAEIRYLN